MSTISQAKPRNLKKRIAACLAATALISAVGSLAVFTDRAQSQATMKAGTLDLALTQTWVDDNAAALPVYAPGDILDLDYTLTNNGNLSTDIREMFVITSDKKITNEFDIYAAADVEQDSSGAYVPKSGATPIEVRSSEDFGTGTKITYNIPQFTVNGTGENAETVDGITSNAKTGDYVLLFNKDAANSVQGTSLKIEYLAQGLQHNNTGNDTWEDSRVISEHITIGGEDISVVPAVQP